MTTTSAARDELLARPYRLFFFGAALHAVVHMLAWTHFLTGGPLPVAGNPLAWHGYEMLIGFGGAVITGFLLTAAANWTGERTLAPAVLVLLVVAWATGRVAHFLGAGPAVTGVADSLFLGGLVVALTRVLIRANHRRNYRFVPIVALLAVGAACYHLATAGLLPDWRYALLHGASDLLLLLMVIMGGRVIPFFTGRRLPALEVNDPGWLGNTAAILVIAALLGRWLLPDPLAAALAWFAACVVLARLIHWSPLGTLHEPMLWILHGGYLWLSLALFLRGGALAWDWMPLSTALHAVVVGGLGCLGLGMMARVALGHGGHALQAPAWLVPAFVLVLLAPIPRLLSAYPALFDPQVLYLLSGGAWIAAFALYAVGFAPVLFGRRADAAR